MQISDAQLRAITHGTGPAMVLAGPGSGKTLVITQRTRHLIEQLHVKPQEILVITFTKAAAQEMRSRFYSLTAVNGVTFGTFHAVFFTILKYAYQYSSANILTEEQKYQMIQQLVLEAGIMQQEEKELIPDIIAEISQVKNEQIPLEYFYSKACPEDSFRKIFSEYERMHRERGMLDFDDMMTYTWELLNARPDILAAWQRRYRYILVDEFQDINMLQYRILRMLAAPENNLFIVGDDDQSIYRFRGAKPEIMLNFPKDYPKAVTVVLDQNFRSLAPVIRASQTVILENQNRFQKQIRPVRSGGKSVDIQSFQNQEHESLYLVKRIRKCLEQGILASEIAILFRTNQGAVPFAERLIEFNMPFEMRDVLPNIYEHWIAKDLFAYFRLSVNGFERSDFMQIMNRPKRYISRDCVSAGTLSFMEIRKYYEKKDWMEDRIDRLEFDLKLMRNMVPYAAINYIRNGIHYEEYLNEYARSHRMRPEELTDILDEIQQSAKPFQTYEQWQEHLEAFRMRLEEQRNRKQNHSEDAVTLATLHSSKGLEFSEVFLVDVNDGIIPHRKAALEADIEEERRLLYVGMTRAKDHLHLYYIKERYGKEMEPSPFLENLIENQIED